MKAFSYFGLAIVVIALSACHPKPAHKPTPKPASSAAAKPAPRPTAPPTPAEEDGSLAQMKADMLPAVNALRAQGCTCGAQGVFPPAPALIWNEKLAKAALLHAQDMATHDRLSHTSSDGSNLPKRMQRVGYTYSQVGENICEGANTVTEAVKLWRESDGHCKNMLNAKFVEFGAAEADGYWVQVFAIPNNAPKK